MVTSLFFVAILKLDKGHCQGLLLYALLVGVSNGSTPLESCFIISAKVDPKLTVQQFPLWVCAQNVHSSSFIHHGSKLETIQMSVNMRMEK